MIVVSYHRIQENVNKNNNPKILRKINFKKQINYLIKNYKVMTNEDILQYLEGRKFSNKYCLLTFDDGTKDHLYAADFLKKKNLSAIFFVNSGTLKKKIPNVFLLQHIFKNVSGSNLKKYFKKSLNLNLDTYIIENEIFKSKYSKNDIYKKIKYFFNFNNNYSKNRKIISKIIRYFKIDKKEISKDFLKRSDLKYLVENNFYIGPHSSNHKMLSKVNKTELISEIKEDIEYFESINMKKNLFAIPYGFKDSYNEKVFNILKKFKIKHVFTLTNTSKNKNFFGISIQDRIDSNKLKFGKHE